jgi:outer membrane protein TolC
MVRALLIILLTLSTARALTLEEAEELALKNYPSLKALSLKAQSLKEQKEVVKRERWGSLNAVSSFSHYNKNRTLYPLSGIPTPNSPPPFDSQMFDYGLAYSLPLFEGGVFRKKAELLKRELLSTLNLKEWKGWQLKLAVDELYLNYLSLKEKEKALIENRKSLVSLLKSTIEMVKAGKKAKVDRLKVEVSLKEVEASIEKVRAQEEYLLNALSTFIGREVKPSDVEPVKVEFKPFKEELPALYSYLKDNSLLKAKEWEVKSSKVQKEITKAKYAPRLNLSASYLRRYGFDSGENDGIGELSLKLSYPLFEFGRKKRELLAKNLQTLSKVKELKEAELSLRREVAKAYSELLSVQSEIPLYEKELELSKEVERIEELRYRSGKGDVNDLLLAKAKRFSAQAELNSAYYRWELSKRRLTSLLEVKDEN